MDTDTATEVKLALCVERIDSIQKTLEENTAAQKKEMREIKEEIQQVSKMLIRYKGTLGGVILTLSAVGTILAFGWNWLIGKHG